MRNERRRLLLGVLVVVFVAAFWGFQSSRRSALPVREVIDLPKPLIEEAPRKGPRVKLIPPPRVFGLDPDTTHAVPIGPGGSFTKPLEAKTPTGENAEAALRVEAPTMKDQVVMPRDDGSDPPELDKTPIAEGVVQPSDSDVTLPQERPEAKVEMPPEKP